MAVHGPPVDDNAVSDLQKQFRGTLLRPNDEGYDEARTIWNAMIDREPALISQCAGIADVKHGPENLFQMNQDIEPNV